MKNYKDNRGFTLIEVIIVVAIMAVLASAIVANLVIVGNTNTKKIAQRLNSKIDLCQTENLTKADSAYLYIFKDSDDNIKTLLWRPTLSTSVDTDYQDHKDVGYDTLTELKAQKFHSGNKTYSSSGNTNITENAVKLADDKVSLYAVSADGTETELGSDGMLKIGFDKSNGSITTLGMTSSAGEKISEASSDIAYIRIKGRSTINISLSKGTGKHFVSGS